MWSEEQYALHRAAAEHLLEIKDEVFRLIKEKQLLTEYAACRFILQEYERRGLATTFVPIVAFDEHAALPHYFPKKKSSRLGKNTLVLIDIWAKVKKRPEAPYADITWVGHVGTPTKERLEVFDVVIKARDEAVSYLQAALKKKIIPTGAEVNEVANACIRKAGYGPYLKHRTGHCIGTASPHGRYKNLSPKNTLPLRLGLGYTIEPGIYIDGGFGVRSEIDFYITKDYHLVITTARQRALVRL